jgi:hypothetical protein
MCISGSLAGSSAYDCSTASRWSIACGMCMRMCVTLRPYMHMHEAEATARTFCMRDAKSAARDGGSGGGSGSGGGPGSGSGGSPRLVPMAGSCGLAEAATAVPTGIRESSREAAAAAAPSPASMPKTCRSAGRSTCCNWRPPRGSPSTLTMRSPTAMRPQASAGPPGLKIVTRLTLSRPRPRPDAQPSTVISYACMDVRGGTGRSGGLRCARDERGRKGAWRRRTLGFCSTLTPAWSTGWR